MKNIKIFLIALCMLSSLRGMENSFDHKKRKHDAISHMQLEWIDQHLSSIDHSLTKDKEQAAENKTTEDMSITHHVDEPPFKRRKESGQGQFTCDFPHCHKAFTCKQYYIVHKATHSEDRPYICNICSKGYKTASNLWTHKQYHKKERAYVCDNCGATFQGSNGLAKHKRSLSH